MPLPADLLVATIFALPDTRKAFTPPVGPEDLPLGALLSAINGQPLISARDGAILTSARN